MDTSVHLLHRHLGVKTFWFCPFFALRRRGAFFAGEFEKNALNEFLALRRRGAFFAGEEQKKDKTKMFLLVGHDVRGLRRCPMSRNTP